jgi:hypothetical protein
MIPHTWLLLRNKTGRKGRQSIMLTKNTFEADSQAEYFEIIFENDHALFMSEPVLQLWHSLSVK